MLHLKKVVTIMEINLCNIRTHQKIYIFLAKKMRINRNKVHIKSTKFRLEENLILNIFFHLYSMFPLNIQLET